MASKRHVHKHWKINLGTKAEPRIVYRCTQPKCTNYYDNYKMMVGKEGICNRCGNVFEYTLAMFQPRLPLKPHCIDCTKSKKADKQRALNKLLEQKLGIFS